RSTLPVRRSSESGTPNRLRTSSPCRRPPVPLREPDVRLRTLVAMVATCGALAAAAGCTTGTDAVNQMNGSDNGFVSGMATTTASPAADRPAAPAGTGTLLDGTRFTLAGDRGHVVVLNFWGSWCTDCRVEANNVQSVHAATAAQGVEFVGVNIRDQVDPANA